MTAAAVTGLAVEARIARRAGLRAEAGGGNPARTAAMIERFIAEGASGLVSFGIAGGLDPALAPGALLVPEAVQGEAGERWPVDAAWRARVVAALAGAGLVIAAGEVLGAAAIVEDAARKAELHRRSGAAAVDLESHLVAQAAARAGLPFLVLRAVADPAERSLPPAVLVGLDEGGAPAAGAVLFSLARRPGQVPALLAVARDTRHALAALLRGVRALGGSRALGMDAGHRVLHMP